jgi:hypothetical protein
MYETSEEKTNRDFGSYAVFRERLKECIDLWKNLTLWGWFKIITVLLVWIGFIIFVLNDGFDWLNGLFK